MDGCRYSAGRVPRNGWSAACHPNDEAARLLSRLLRQVPCRRESIGQPTSARKGPNAFRIASAHPGRGVCVIMELVARIPPLAWGHQFHMGDRTLVTGLSRSADAQHYQRRCCSPIGLSATSYQPTSAPSGLT
jgi:hypothetical protein